MKKRLRPTAEEENNVKYIYNISDYIFNYWNEKIFKTIWEAKVTFQEALKELEEQTRKTAYKSYRIMGATL